MNNHGTPRSVICILLFQIKVIQMDLRRRRIGYALVLFMVVYTFMVTAHVERVAETVNDPIMERLQSQQWLLNELESGRQVIVGRTGTSETAAIKVYQNPGGDLPKPGICCAGFWQNDRENYIRLGKLHADGIGSCNAMAMFNWQGWQDQWKAQAAFCPDCVRLSSGITYPPCMLERLPPTASVPRVRAWTSWLAGKTVLVISPFETSIKTNYANREKIWSTGTFAPDDCLGNFTLKTVRTSLPRAHPSGSWFDQIER